MLNKKAKRILALISAVLFMILCLPVSFAQDETTALIPENDGIIKQKLTDYAIEHEGSITSVSAVVFNKDGVITDFVYGFANKAEKTPADENTVYEWGSVTKVLTWTSVMQLYERGQIDFSEDIYTYLPKSFTDRLPKYEHFTILDLMNHTAGFQETIWEVETSDLDKLLSLDEGLILSAPAQTYKPGEHVSYSNWGAALAGYTVECITGMKFSEYVKQNIFAPLGMEHTSIAPDISDNEWVKEQRKKTHCFSYMDGAEDLGECRRYIHLYPAGAACGTVSDMALFAQAFLQDGSECRLFQNPGTLSLMLSPSRYFSDGETCRISHGMYMSKDRRLIGHGGATEGFSSDLELNLTDCTGYVVLTNTSGERLFTSELYNLLYGKNEYEAGEFGNPVDISGTYDITRSLFGEGYFRIFRAFSDRITITKVGDRFTSKDGMINFTQIDDNTVKVEIVPTGGVQFFRIRRNASGTFEGFELYSATDYIKLDNRQIITEYIMTGLLAVGLLAGIVLFIIHIIRLRKFKDSPLHKFKTLEMVANSIYLSLPLFIFILFRIALIFLGSRTNLMFIPCIAISLLAVSGFFMYMMCWLKKDKPEKKVILIIETVCAIFVIVGIAYWRLYQFWGL